MQGAGVRVERPPLLVGADHLVGGKAGQCCTGLVPVRDAMLGIDHEHRHGRTIDDLRQAPLALELQRFGTLALGDVDQRLDGAYGPGIIVQWRSGKMQPAPVLAEARKWSSTSGTPATVSDFL